jgi:hypothetical protein
MGKIWEVVGSSGGASYVFGRSGCAEAAVMNGTNGVSGGSRRPKIHDGRARPHEWLFSLIFCFLTI